MVPDQACINYILGPEKHEVIEHPTFKQDYFDTYTNVVFLDLTVYDYLVEQQLYVRLSVEFIKGGGVTCSHSLTSVQVS